VPARAPEHPPLRGMGDKPRDDAAMGEAIEDESRETETVFEAGQPEDKDHVMLVRPRKSRIYYLRKFFDYPINLSSNTIRNLGPVRMTRIGFSYIAARLHPIKAEKSL
jgi:hypothetical protein